MPLSSADIEIIEIAGALAWGALKEWHGARDIKPPMSAADCGDAAQKYFGEWIFGQGPENAVELLAREILWNYGLRVDSGDINTGVIVDIMEGFEA